MTSRFAQLTFLFAIGIAFSVTALQIGAAAPNTTKPSADAPRWEYQIVRTYVARDNLDSLSDANIQQLEEKLNDLGGQGWELVSAGDVRLIFKRPKSSE